MIVGGGMHGGAGMGVGGGMGMAGGVGMAGGALGGVRGGVVGGGGIGVGGGMQAGMGVGVGGGVAAGAGGAACCGCAAEADTASMAFVGMGAGAYTTETTYRYVGLGAGEFDYIAPPKKTNFLCFVGVGGLAVVAIIVVLLLIIWPGVVSTTTPPATGPPSECLIWGDPHVDTFDHSFPSFYDEGIYWVVKSATVKIQARNLATPYTKGLAATHSIAVGGPFLGGHTIVVGPLEAGHILVDGRPALTSFPSTMVVSGSIELSYNGEGRLVDSSLSHLPKKIVHMNLPMRVHIQVMRWDNHINVRIVMKPRVGGQDGLCGNFNGDPSDDTNFAIMARTGGPVPPSEVIFHHMVPARRAPRHDLQECMNDRARYQDALQKCQAEEPSVTSNELVKGCVYDVCFAGPQYAAQDGMAESAVR